ncbi:MAG: YlxR family protein [Candidatus Binatia bacterium]
MLGPQRTCLGCGARDDKRQLIRLRAGAPGELIVDDSGAGRGGYLHRSQECWEKFKRRKSVYRAFHIEIGKTVKEKLVDSLKERHGD